MINLSARKLVIVASASLWISAFPCYGQQFQESTSANEGSKSTFSLTLTQSHGVSSSVTMTPDYIVKTTANLVVGPGSKTEQTTLQSTSASLNPNGDRGLEANGASGTQTINYGDGTQYQVQISPRITSEVDQSWKAMPLSQASGQATGISTTQLTVDSTTSSFVNTFVNSLSN